MADDNAATGVSEPPPAAAPGPLAIFMDRRTLVMLGLGFGAGLPNFLIFSTLSAWLRDAGLSLAVISFFSLATLAYSLKFLWAPLVDRTSIPGLTAWLGHRRSWMLAAQVAVTAGIIALSISDPKRSLSGLALCAVLTGFASATQDIVVDAWRIEVSEANRQGAMATAYQWGYRIAGIAAGAGALALADRIGWNLSYGVMALLMTVAVISVFGAPPERERIIRPFPENVGRSGPALEGLEWLARLALLVSGGLLVGSGLAANANILAQILSGIGLSEFASTLKAAWVAKPNGVWLQLLGVLAGFGVIAAAAWPIPRVSTRPGVYLSRAFAEPLADFFMRFGATAGLILALICVYRLSDFVLNIMTPFYQDLGFTDTQIGEAQKGFGLIPSMLGVLLGGLSVARFGLMRSLVTGAFALPIANTIFAWLSTQGPNFPSLLTAIGIDNIVSGYAGTCLIAYMSSLTSAGFTATQYALFSSLYSLPGKLVASQSGRLVESAARAASGGGKLSFLRGLFTHTPATAFAHAMEKSHVDPKALGSGYVVFFFYSGLVGVISMALAVIVARRTPTAGPSQPSDA